VSDTGPVKLIGGRAKDGKDAGGADGSAIGVAENAAIRRSSRR
jgi:hypothetical protein